MVPITEVGHGRAIRYPGVSHLVDAFSYVTYNGRWISETEAVTISAGLANRGHVVV